MTPASDFLAWHLWLMRNCAGCSVDPCRKYQRLFRAVEVAGNSDPVKDEPDCAERIAVIGWQGRER